MGQCGLAAPSGDQDFVEIFSSPSPPITPINLHYTNGVSVTSGQLVLTSPRTPITKIEAAVINLVTPSKTKLQANDKPEILNVDKLSPFVSRQHKPLASVVASHGPIQEGKVFVTWEEGRDALYAEEERRGHKWKVAQGKHDQHGRKKVILRCNHYYHHQPTHQPNLDPSEYRKGRSIRTGCNAHVNFNRVQDSSLWHITFISLVHNHDREIPPGGLATRPPNHNQRQLVSKLVNDSAFTRGHITKILSKQFPEKPLEPRQVSNMMGKVRMEARREVKALGGDVASIIAKLQERIRSGENWTYHLRLDENQTVIGLWWQSPEQAELVRRYPDILINDNTYNRNQYQYPLDIGVIIDSHGMSRNGWYSFHAKEDTDTHSWVFRCHLDSAGSPPEILVSERHGSLIASASLTMPLTLHVFCLHHLNGNVATKIRPILGPQWDDFTRDFWATYRAVSPDEFERLWADLVTRYPGAEPYMNEELYPCQERWAWAWISHVFTAGIRTNGRVEAENCVNKAFGGPKKTLLQLFDSLNEHTNGQTAKEMTAVRQVKFSQHAIFQSILTTVDVTDVSSPAPGSYGNCLCPSIGSLTQICRAICSSSLLQANGR
jgi:MULE transposase domain